MILFTNGSVGVISALKLLEIIVINSSCVVSYIKNKSSISNIECRIL